MLTNWQEQFEKLMKPPSESFCLGVIGSVAVGIICFAGLAMEYGWFGYGEPESPSAVISHGFTSEVSSREPYINVNTASVAKLKTVPGIGEELARQIVLYRQFNGEFEDITQLLEVHGMDKDTLILINPYITCE